MKRIFLLFLIYLVAMSSNAQEKESYLLVGSYTPAGTTEGIHVYRFNSQTAESVLVSSVATSNATYLAVAPNEKYVYAVHENADDIGSIAAFRFDKSTGSLTYLNKSSSGNHPCYVTIDNKGKWVIAGNYTGGSVAVLSVSADGSLEYQVSVIQHEGSGKNKERQDKAHVHCTFLSPDNTRLYVPDLGMDKVMIYAFDTNNGKLTNASQPFVQSEPGSGPRHFTFHPSGKYAYLIEELSGTVEVFQYNDGTLMHIQKISSTPSGQEGYAGGADIHVSPDGKFLYTTNRGDFDNIAIYSIHPGNGQLTSIGFQSTLGKSPRNFNFDPTGNYLLAGNQESDEIVIFKRDLQSGQLSDTGKRISVNKPACLKWINTN